MSQRSPLRHPNMNLDFFSYLPSEIVIDILSRLPVRAIMTCKCVRKSWLDLVESREFAKSHFSKSVPGLALCQDDHVHRSSLYEVYEFEDAIDLESHHLHYNRVTKFDLPFYGWINGSCDGLLFLRGLNKKPHPLYICNPITREYFTFYYPKEIEHMHPQVVAYGFGASKLTGQHKVVRIFHDCRVDQETSEPLEIIKSECQIYTLETGLWRSVAPGAQFDYESMTNLGIYVNVNLHWLVYDLNGSTWISCFDLDTELFSTFSLPPQRHHSYYFKDIVALEDHLCLCYSSNHYNEILIWSMEEYGVEKSWTKKYITCRSPGIVDETIGMICAVKVFKDGDILMSLCNNHFFHYSKKDDTTNNIDKFEHSDYSNGILHKPSFLPLKCFGMENITSF